VLYMLLSRYLNLDKHSPGHTAQQADSLMLTVSETLDSTSDLSGRPVKGAWIREHKVLRLGLLVWTLFGASCVMADGLLTPAVSVISAVAGTSNPIRLCLLTSGIAIPAPVLNDSIVPISIAIIVVLVLALCVYLLNLVPSSTVRHKVLVHPLCTDSWPLVPLPPFDRSNKYCQQ
jgi:hypothetical protein